jgi:hypothetical protein
LNRETSVERLTIPVQSHEYWLLCLRIDSPLGESATRSLVRPVGRLALSLLIAGMSLLRRRFAPAIPPKRTFGPSCRGFKV